MEDLTAAEARRRIAVKKHPFTEANLLSKIFFTWNLSLFYNGLKRDLNKGDLYPPLNSHNSKLLGDKLQAAWEHELKTKNYPSLWRAILNVFKRDILLLMLASVMIDMVLRLSQPLALNKFLQYFQSDSPISKNEAYIYASVIVIASFLSVIFIHQTIMQMVHLGMRIRVACCALIYRKSLRLSKSALAETTIGQMVNLLSNDVNRFEFAVLHINGLWLAPVLIILIVCLLATYVGYTALVGVGFLILFVPFQVWVAKKASVYRLRTALRTDERIRLMNEIIMGIQVIKMYTWEKPFAKLVEISRRKEIQQIQNASILRAISLSFMLVLNRAAIYFCILTYVLCGNTITSHYVYVTTAFYEVLRPVITIFFPQGITFLAETRVSVRRIRQFLLYDETKTSSSCKSDLSLQNGVKQENDIMLSSIINKNNKDCDFVTFDNVNAKWISKSPENSLEDINLKITSNELVAIVGPVGSGKTTLLHLILKELLPTKGTVNINGTISYASQEPWLFAGSVQQNILFGQKFDPSKYLEVVRVCALSRDFALLPDGDRTIVGERGVTLSGGQRARINLARAIYKEADIYLLDDPLSAVDTHVGKHLFDRCIMGYLNNKCVVLVTHQLQYLQNVKNIVLMENGKIEASGNYHELKASGKEFTNLLSSTDEKENEGQGNKRRLSRMVSEKQEEEEKSSKDAPEQEKEGMVSGKVSWNVYTTYISSGGPWSISLLIFLTFILAQFFASGVDYFVAFWANLEQMRSENKTSLNNTTSIPFDSYFTEQNLIIIYSSLILLGITLTLLRSVGFFVFSMQICKRLHNRMFKVIVHATMNFFNSNPSGRILNRFSKDMGYIDEALPMTVLDTIQIGLMVAAITIIIAVVNPWVLLPCAIMLLIFYGLRIIFLASSRNIKRLEGITRSPIFSHLSASLQGLTTIRSFGAEEILTTEFDYFQDAYSGAYYMFLGANRTFGFWLDMHCVVFVALVTYGFLFMSTETFGGNVGLAITQSIALTGLFQWGMRQWSEMENQMTSVERVKEYMDLKPEPDSTNKSPSISWPKNGNITFDNVSLRYFHDQPYVLKNLTFQINNCEKIGIVGRTGAGKSSLIIALFRLAETEGRIIIDNLNTSDIPLRDLRSKISIIPQEPVLFSGTLRKNLDPFDEYDDNILWDALQQVELKNAVSELPSGLESRMSEGGTNFSVGQRQLVCLARAIIRNNKILVLDEATANVDPQTDALIQSTIREKFANCTVLTIAHRLHTIMDADKVLVMDAGRVVQFDHPHRLLEDSQGVFFKLVEQTGKGMAENLTAIAEESYKEKNGILNECSDKTSEL